MAAVTNADIPVSPTEVRVGSLLDFIVQILIFKDRQPFG
jgi:hypothetical protein